MGNCCSPGCRLWCLWWCLFVLSFFPRGVLDQILNLIESFSEGFPSYTHCQPSSKWALLSNRGKKSQRDDRGRFRLSYAVPKTQRTSTPTPQKVIWLWTEQNRAYILLLSGHQCDIWGTMNKTCMAGNDKCCSLLFSWVVEKYISDTLWKPSAF